MGDFNFNKTKIDGVYIIEPKVFGDNRGYFAETYNKEHFAEAGLNIILSEKDKIHPRLKELDLSQYSDFNICLKEV